MGSINFECPLPAALTVITGVTCPEKFGQIQRWAFRQKSTSEDTTFTSIADLLDDAQWAIGIADAAAARIVITPFIAAPVIPAGTFITEEGNNNNTVNGIKIISGTNNVEVTGRFLNLPTAIAEKIRALLPFSALTPGLTNLEAFGFNEFGHIIHDMDGARPKGFPVYNVGLPSVGSEGLNKPNVHNFSFEMLGNWDANLLVSIPVTFNPLNF